ncbi:hypothetical protein KCG34_21405 [Phenylobacterium montanum]|uniref:Tetratricopeptide repeat protein n=2 Tax=Phenylobacterium montanum TaxID=2823693 RepID=A0A975G593_9CAUL|nr:hypothetical protein KCG34_21405 [Caulobacter sp. S6]
MSSRIAGVALGLGLGWFISGPAAASVTVLGANFAHQCYLAAKFGEKYADDPVDICTRSIENESLQRHDLAGTFVNRGVLYMQQGAFKAAEKDFRQAQTLMPNLGEASVNLGGALIGERRYKEGVDEITRGLTLNPEEPEKAFYNRALGFEGLDDMKSAYFDYLHAQQIKPDWAPPKAELSRFTVKPKE